MSIHVSTLHFLLAINKEKKIKGNFLSIGKQTVYISYKKIESVLNKYFKKKNLKKKILSIDNFTRNKNLKNIDDSSLLGLFTKTKYYALDKSSYENADKILDLNNKNIPTKFVGKYDFIYDGGTLDNIFSPSQGISNFSKILKTNGRILHTNVGGAWPGAYCSFSCEWFYSFYANNNYKNVQVYLLIPEKGEWPNPNYSIYLYSPYFKRKKNYDPLYASKQRDLTGATIICYAEKGEKSSNNKIPIQSHYIEKDESDWRKKSIIFSKKKISSLMLDKKINKKKLPFLSNHYKFIGSTN